MIKCEICGKKFKILITSGHLRKHKITLVEYKKQFPNAAVISEETCKLRSKAMQKRIKEGRHFVPFRDIKGFAKKVHAAHIKRVKYTCIRCGKIRETFPYWAKRRKFCSVKCMKQYIIENPKLQKARNKAISEAKKGKPQNGGYSRCKGGFRTDIGHYVRSGWEADVCRVFIYNNCPYDYESYTIMLKDGKNLLSWIVDFVDPNHLLSDGLIEVKGWWDKKSKKKLRLLKKQRADIYQKMTFICEKEIIQLRNKYSALIPEWESQR